jgi:hypothetical protein
MIVGSFSGSYNNLQDKPIVVIGAPEYYELLPFFLDNTLTLMAQSNDLISGLELEVPGSQHSYFRADRLITKEISLLNEPIENIALPELYHHAALEGYVDNCFVAYTPATEQLKFQFEALYARK